MNAPASNGSHDKRFLHGRRLALLIAAVLVVAIVLIVIFAVPPYVTKVVNRKLAELPEYSGRVADIDMEFLRGALTVKDLTLTSRKYPEDGPVVKIPYTRMVIDWRPLLHGMVRGDAVIENAEWAVFNDEAIPDEQIPRKKEQQEEMKERVETVEKVREWQEILREAFPMELSRIDLRNARIRFVDRTMNPAPEIVMESVAVVATGLGNQPKGTGDLPASVKLDGVIKTGGRVSVEARLNPIAEQPRFETLMKVEGLELPPLNDFARFYAKADVLSGRFTVYINATAEGGGYHGTLNPFFEGLDFKAVKEEKNIIKRVATKVADAVASVLESDKDKVASEIPFQGNFSDNDVDIWTTIRNLLRNAFVQALREGFSGEKSSD